MITATIEGREDMLEELEASVRSQTNQEWEHLVLLDQEREGCSVMVNRMVEEAQGTWLLPIADDDLLLPRCIETLLEHSENADIVYSPPLVTGNEDRWWFFQAPPVIPSTALVRTSLWRECGGYDEALANEEDRHLWIRAMEAGARFVRVDQPTWVYRMHDSNKSFSKATA